MNETIDLGKFPKGINNVAPDTDLPEGSLVSAVNVDIDKEGNVISRKGYTKVYSGNNIHSLYKSYFVEGTELKEFNGISSSTLVFELRPNRFLAWEEVNGAYIYSDGLTVNMLNHGQLGVSTPSNNPTLSETTGLLDKGIYQVAICHIDRNTGEVSGANIASTITVSDSGGILLTDIPISPEGYDIIIFVSTQNGEGVYQNGTVLNGVTTYTVINSRKSTNILSTQFMSPMLGGHIIRHYNARLYIANDNVLYFSEPFRYGLMKTAKNFFQFNSKITVLQVVEDGIYVIADKTYFLQGNEPKDMQQLTVSLDKAIEGTGITVSADLFDIESSSQMGYWFSEKGAMLGMPSGQIKQVTKNNIAINEDLMHGVSMLKEIEGIRQLITNFSSGGTSSGFKFGAVASSQIIRNGVIIP